MQMELPKHKLDCMQQQQAQKAKEEQRKAKKEELVAREWEHIQVNIRQRSKDIKNETDEDLKHDIQYIEACTDRKNFLQIS